MISSQKFRLFVNDPKFQEVKDNKLQTKELAIHKVFPGQKIIHRNDVIMDSIKKKKNPSLPSINQDIDFLQGRLHSFQNTLINDMQSTFEEKQKIKKEHVNIEHMHKKSSETLISILSKAAQNEQLEEDTEIEDIEKSIMEIKQLFEQNQKLKAENEEISKRIQYKKASLYHE